MLLRGKQREKNKWSPPLKNPSPPLPSPPSTPLSLPPTNLHPGEVHVSQQAKFLHTLTAAALSYFVWPMHVKSRTLSVEWQVKDREIQGWKNKNTSNTQVHTYIHTWFLHPSSFYLLSHDTWWIHNGYHGKNNNTNNNINNNTNVAFWNVKHPHL